MKMTACGWLLRLGFVMIAGWGTASVIGEVSPLAGASEVSPNFPMKVSANHRYLEDQHGRAVFLQGDAAWSLIPALTEVETETYLEQRRTQGFNALIVNLVEHHFNGPVDRAGEGPFLVPGDFSTPNEKYFAHADRVIRQAAGKGLTVFLAPCYLGYKGLQEGWYEEIQASGLEKCRGYGQFLGRRYRDFDNIVWIMGGDRDPGNARAEVHEIALGIKEFDSRHLFTAHCEPEQSPVNGYANETWLDLNNSYSYAIVHQKLLADYRHEPTRPNFLIESTYEHEHNATPLQIRRQAYWSLLCGACGHFLGIKPVWLFDPGWQAALTGPASRDLQRFNAFLHTRAWPDLVPDLNHTVLTEGWGEENGLDYAAAARTTDGATIIIYTPTSRKLTVNLTKINGAQVRAWWFNPRTGDARSGGVYSPTAATGFTPPAEGDWALVLDDAAKKLPPPGAPTGS